MYVESSRDRSPEEFNKSRQNRRYTSIKKRSNEGYNLFSDDDQHVVLQKKE